LKQRVQDLLVQGDKLFSQRYPLLTLWQLSAEQFNPIRADMTRKRSISEEFASFLMTGAPLLAQRDLTSQIGAMLRPRQLPWFKAGTGDDKVDKDAGAAQWLDAATQTLKHIIYDRRAQFTRSTKEADGDYVTFGQAVIELADLPDRLGWIYRTVHLRDAVWSEDAHQQIDTFHRDWKPQARQLARLFPKTISSRIREKLDRDPNAEIDCRVIVMPADEYESPTLDQNVVRKYQRKLPFIRIVVDRMNECILEETPQHDLGYVIPRWVTIGGWSQYAYSPAVIVAMADGRMLQQITLTLLEAGQKAVDPPLVAVGEAIQGGVNAQAGGVTYVDSDYDERTGEVLRPMVIDKSGLPWGGERETRIEQAIRKAFYLDLLRMPDVMGGEKMTAYEVQKRWEQYVQSATPLFEPIQDEYNWPLLEMSFGRAFRMGAFGSAHDMPQVLRGADMQWKFRSPIDTAEGEQKTTSFTRVSQLLAAAIEIEPNVRADVDIDTAFRDAVAGTGAPANWLVDEKVAMQTKQNMQAQQAAAAQAQKLGQLAEAGGKIGAAAQNIGDASTSLQDAGLV
jgi:hypothetical protein